MKKILITLMTVLALTVCTACESTDAEKTNDEKPSVSDAADVEKEEKEEAEKETKEEKETEAAEETASEVYEGNGYTLSINEKWMDASAYREQIAALAGELEASKNMGITSEDLLNSNDSMFFFVEDASISFNVVATEIGDIGTLDKEMLEQLAIAMESQYGVMTGYIYKGYEIVNVNGYDALRIDLDGDASVFGTELQMNVYMLFNGSKQYAVTYSATKASYDKAFAEFETVLNSISLG